MTRPSESTIRKIIMATVTTVVGAVAVALVFWVPQLIADQHEKQHEADTKQAQAVAKIAQSNAQYINDQILVALYLRQSTLNEQLATDPGNAELRRQSLETGVQIQRRESVTLPALLQPEPE